MANCSYSRQLTGRREKMKEQKFADPMLWNLTRKRGVHFKIEGACESGNAEMPLKIAAAKQPFRLGSAGNLRLLVRDARKRSPRPYARRFSLIQLRYCNLTPAQKVRLWKNVTAAAKSRLTRNIEDAKRLVT
jgi:hypothetical protein